MLRRRLVFVAALTITLAGAAPGNAHAQSTASAAALYPLPAYDENWRHLRDSAQPRDPWDGIKFVPLSRSGDAFATFGGDARLTYERFGHQDFGLTPPDHNGYLLQRYLARADLHASSWFRTFAELNTSIQNDRFGGPRPVLDRNELDLHQLFVDVASRATTAGRVFVRLGRQEFAVGSGRLYSLREGPNVPSSFDGARLGAQVHQWRLDGWFARPVINRTGVFDDRSGDGYRVWGAYASAGSGPAGSRADLYYLGLTRDAARFDQGVADETRHTVGARLFRGGAWSYDGEGMFQFGRFGAGRIRAWRLAANTTRLLTAAAWRPRLAIDIDVASGDRNQRDIDLQTFNSMFQSGTYSGRAQLLGPNNSIRFEPAVSFAPRAGVTVSAGWGFYWRQSEQDGLYGIPGQLVVPGNGAAGHYEGSRPITQIDWQVTRHLSAHAAFIYVFNGEFEQASVHGTETMSYLSPWVAYRF